MIAILDAAYADTSSAAACVLSNDGSDPVASSELIHRAGPPAAYQPGEFFRRERPLLLALINSLPTKPDMLVIDGYVWLDGQGRPGLGAHLHEAFGRALPVIGVGKTRFADADQWAAPILRGASTSPLYITAAGLPLEAAVQAIQLMHGPSRIPTLIARADRLARDALLSRQSGPA